MKDSKHTRSTVSEGTDHFTQVFWDSLPVISADVLSGGSGGTTSRPGPQRVYARPNRISYDQAVDLVLRSHGDTLQELADR